MERFVKLNLASDPSPWETKKALKGLGLLDDGSENLDVRLNRAAIAAVNKTWQRVEGSSINAIAGSI
jgi:hypothetical protein